jgi:SAM-dependent methyltransferase
MPANVHQGDLFEDHPELGQFDVVYSLGLIEHFDDVPAVIERHVRLAKPGGLLVVGCPNLVGLNGWFLERVAPDILAKHNQAMMHLSTWDLFERKLGLSRLSRRCVGGLAPAVFDRWEKPSVRSAALRAVAKALKLGSRWTWASYLDSPWWSHYLIAAYRVP